MRRGEGPSYSYSQAPDTPLEYMHEPAVIGPEYFIPDAYIYHRPRCFGMDDGPVLYPGGRTRYAYLAGGCTNQNIKSLVLRLKALYVRAKGGPGKPVHIDYSDLQTAVPPYLKTKHDLSRASIALPLFYLERGVCLHDFVVYSLGPGRGKHNALANKKEFTVTRRLPTCKEQYEEAADWKRAADLDAHYHEIARLAYAADSRTTQQRLEELFQLPAGKWLHAYFGWLQQDKQ